MRTKVSSASTSLYIAILFAFAAVSAFASGAAGQSRSVEPATVSPVARSGKALDTTSARAAYEKLPIAFEKNEGQAAAPVQYVAHGDGFELFLTPKEAFLALQQPGQGSVGSGGLRKGALRKSERVSEVALEFEGANAAPAISGQDQLVRRTNYFVGNDPKKWHTDISSFSAVQYKGIYRGVDAVFYGNQRRLEYDFVVAPGADPKQIALKIQGARELHIDANGNLVLSLPKGSVELLRPVVYQDVNGVRRDVAGGYRLGKNDRVELALAEYDASRPLIIDPVLNYSTFISGGTSMAGTSGDFANAVAVDALGDAFVTGETFNASFPTGTKVGLGTPDGTGISSGAAFVSEIDPTGTTELYFSYLSGDGGDTGITIALDPATAPNANCMNGAVPSVCVYVAGATFSDNFPTTASAYNNATPPNTAGSNAFLAKLNPYVAGSGSLVYSTYLASTASGDQAFGLAVDAHQHAYLTGIVFASPGAPPAFPITASTAAQATLSNGSGNAYLTAIDTTRSGTAGLLYSTYLGGNGANANSGFGDAGEGVVVDASGIAYIVGFTTSTDFPSIASTGTFPAIKGYSALPSGNTLGAAFVSAINTTASGAASLPYSTYLGGSSTNTPDLGAAIALAGSGVVYVTGSTSSADFPVSESGSTFGQFPSPGGTTDGVAFITKLDTTTTISPPPSAPPYSVLLGGNSGDFGLGIAVDSLGKVIVAGATGSSDFPITRGAFQPTLVPTSVGAGFVAKLDPTVSGSAGLLYSTFFGGLGNPSSSASDEILGVALGTSPTSAYIVGKAFSGTNFPIFPSGAFQNTYASGAFSASFVANLNLIPTVTVSPTSLTFTGGVVGIASVPQTVTLTNNTSTGVVMTSVTVVAGTPLASSTDFATTNNTCAGTIAAGTSCTVGVTLTPSVTTTETATLTFTDSDTSSPQTVGLTGSGTSAPSLTVTALPTTLTFPSQTVNTASSAMTVTVTNTGNAPVTLASSSAVSIAGTNMGDFSIGAGTTCTASLVLTTSGVGSSCVIKIVFTPAATGARTATLSVADNASGSPQMVTLGGTGTAAGTPDFSLTPSTQSVSVTQGGTALFTVDVVGLNGFTSAVTLSCAGAPHNSTCTAPSPVNASPSPGTAATFSVVTKSFVPPASRNVPPVSPKQLVLLAGALSLLLLLPSTRRFRTRLGLAGAMAVLVIAAGCSGTPPTPRGSYTLTVTGTSGSLTHTATVDLTVQ